MSYENEHRIIKDGEVRWHHTKGELVKDDKGKPLKLFGVMQDITESKKAQETLEESEEALKKAQNIAKIDSWEMDTITKKLVWSNQLYDILEISYHKEPTFELYYSRVHQDDFAYVKKIGEKVYKNNEAAVLNIVCLCHPKQLNMLSQKVVKLLMKKTMSLN